jgi:diguanylate cyclase (GGDEF)-like protein
MDTLSRFAGDTFVAVLPAASAEVAAHVAGRVRAAVESADFPSGAGGAERLGVSVGVAAYPEAGETADDVIQAATREMLRDKRARQAPHAPGPSDKVIRLDSFR